MDTCYIYERVITMTKKDLEILRNQHKENFDSSTNDDHPLGTWYELGWVDALEFVLKHFDELYLDEHRQNAIEDAKDHIYSYFESRYDGDDSDELPETLEERYQRALDEGDAEKLADIFLNKCDCTISEDDQWDLIVEDFYD